MHVQYDARLDDRQLLTPEQLGGLHSDDLDLASLRVELVLEGAAPIPHVDIIFGASSRDRVVVALGLPFDRDNIVWPKCFSAWPEEFLERVSTRVLGELTGKSLQSGHQAFFSNPAAGHASTLEEILKGRSCPGLDHYWAVAQLLARYRLAASALQGGRLLEFACGAGFGAGWLLKRSGLAASYLGLDPDPGYVTLANLLNVDARARFQAGSPDDLGQDRFDCILCFGTIARAADPEVFLESLKSRLNPGGRLMISLPCERWHGFHANRGHWSSWNLSRVRKLIEPHFQKLEYHRHQRPSFTENAFATGRLEPLDPNEDRAHHEGYLMVLEGPLHPEPRRRIVIQRRYARGDALQATPIIRALRTRYPQHLVVASTDVSEVFMNNPDVDLLMATSSGYRPKTDDLVVNLDEAYEKRPHLHILDAYTEVAREPLDDPRPRLFPNRWDYEAAGRLIEQGISKWKQVKYLIAVHLCRTPDRSWPADHWGKFLSAVVSSAEIGVLVVGAGADMGVSDNDYIINCVNKADLLTTAALISLTDCLIGPDSSLLHVAASMGTAAIGLYGMVLPELRVPYGATQSAIIAPVECAGCLKSLPPPVTNPRCKFPKSFCMEAISPQVVLARLESLKAVMQEKKWVRRYDLMRGRGGPARPTAPTAAGAAVAAL